MGTFRSWLSTGWAPVAIVAAVAIAACGGGGRQGGGTSPNGDVDAGGNADGGGVNLGGSKTLKSIAVSPATATITSLNGVTASQAFTVVGSYSDGTTAPLTSGVTWSSSEVSVGAVDGVGKYTANGLLGGVVSVNATSMGSTASAQLTVKLVVQENPGNISGSVQTQLTGATTVDTATVWAYPYNGTVLPRGLNSIPLMWNGGAASDVYFIHLTSATYDLQTFAMAPPPASFSFSAADWTAFVGSTTGAAQLHVARWDGTSATVVTDMGWSIAPQSMRGTIYYWSNNVGRVMRIQPGATAPDDFANAPPLNDPSMYTQSSCLMTCHVVSADGSTIVSGGGTFGGSFNLLTNQPTYYLGGTWGNPNGTNSGSVVEWMDSALSPNGKYLLVNTMGVAIDAASGSATAPANFEGLYDATTGTLVPNSGFDGLFPAMPAFSPDASKVAFVDSGDPLAGGWTQGWNIPPPGDLKLIDYNASGTPMGTNVRTLVATGADPTMRIGWPTISPDGNWVLYQRGASADTRYGNGDLYIANTQTGAETRLAALDGDGYPFAAGARDLSWNFEPAFAPVSAGGYFWVVFTSRRTYGNVLTGAPNSDSTGFIGTKQLWVAAIDQNPAPGADPSHPPFLLPGQDITTINMRGFWALDPCKSDGNGCGSGTECCGGYCTAGGDGGAGVCMSQQTSCSQDGDRCDMTSDCCDATSGVTCINHVCSQAPPR
jgi:hypothetical protein